MATDAVKDMALVPQPSSALSIFERMATMPGMTVESLERLVAMKERMDAKEAEQQFNAAMAKAQSEMGRVRADAYNPQTKSRFLSYAGMDREIRPIYTANGFGVSFDSSESPKPAHMRLLAHVSHIGGHVKTYTVDMPSDGKGAKGGDVMTLTHAFGAGTSYGMRYLQKMIWNIAVGEDDNDGNLETPKTRQSEPNGFEEWLIDMESVALEGESKLKQAWEASKPELRKYLTAHHAAKWSALKMKAAKVMV